MVRVHCYIDGFNLYYAIMENPNFVKYKWLNLRSLCQMFIGDPKLYEIQKIYYFSAYCPWKVKRQLRHRTYVKALRTERIDCVMGEMFRESRTCKKCGHTYIEQKEKQTDINIATTMLTGAYQNKFDVAFLITGDSDMVPVIKKVQNVFGKKVTSIFPPNRESSHIKQVAHSHKKIEEVHLKNSPFPNVINGTIFNPYVTHPSPPVVPPAPFNPIIFNP